MHFRSVTSTVFLLLLISSAARATIILKDSDPQAFGTYPQYIIDHDSSLQIEDVRNLNFHTHKVEVPSFGCINDTVWLRADFKKLDKKAYILKVAYPLLDWLDLYLVKNNKIVYYKQSGDHVIGKKTIDKISPAFRLPREPGNYTAYLRISTTSSTQAPMTIYPEDDFYQKEKEDLFFTGLYVGILDIMALYNMSIFFSSRNTSYFYYTMFVTGMLWAQLSISGHLTAYLFHKDPSLNDLSTILSGNLTTCGFALFAHHFLKLWRHYKWAEWIKIVLLALFSNSIIGYYLLPYTFIIKSLTICASSLATAVVVVAFRQTLRGQREAVFLTLSCTAMITGLVIYALKQLGYVPHNFYSHYSFRIGSVIEVSVLSLALADRLNTLRFGLKHVFGQLSKIVYPHQIAMIRQGITLEKTMPVNQAEAFVICFDIVASLMINHPKTKDFILSVFSACYAVMNENYVMQPLQSKAFRLKEMGDGFLCSVGYPFSCPEENPAVAAVTLAHKFNEIVKKESLKSFGHSKTYCGIGIAHGLLAGFYPASGTKEYDMFGRPIVLANRYESLRKGLDRGRSESSIMFVHEKVFDHLDNQTKSNLIKIDLTEEDLIVRDNPETKVVYFQQLDADTKASQPPMLKAASSA